MKIETRAVHAGRKPEGGSRDVVPAIHLSTTFHKADDGTLPGGYLYGRPNNPNRESLEHALASLEEGAAALAFSSGSAATLAVFQALSPGDHVIAAEDAYYGTPILLRTVMANWGLKHTLINMQDLAAVERAITPATRLIWTERPPTRCSTLPISALSWRWPKSAAPWSPATIPGPLRSSSFHLNSGLMSSCTPSPNIFPATVT